MRGKVWPYPEGSAFDRILEAIHQQDRPWTREALGSELGLGDVTQSLRYLIRTGWVARDSYVGGYVPGRTMAEKSEEVSMARGPCSYCGEWQQRGLVSVKVKGRSRGLWCRRCRCRHLPEDHLTPAQLREARDRYGRILSPLGSGIAAGVFELNEEGLLRSNVDSKRPEDTPGAVPDGTAVDQVADAGDGVGDGKGDQLEQQVKKKGVGASHRASEVVNKGTVKKGASRKRTRPVEGKTCEECGVAREDVLRRKLPGRGPAEICGECWQAARKTTRRGASIVQQLEAGAVDDRVTLAPFPRGQTFRERLQRSLRLDPLAKDRTASIVGVDKRVRRGKRNGGRCCDCGGEAGWRSVGGRCWECELAARAAKPAEVVDVQTFRALNRAQKLQEAA